MKYKFNAIYGHVECITSCRPTKDGIAYGGYSKTYDEQGKLIKQTEWSPNITVKGI